MGNWSIIGHAKIIEYLKNSVKNQSLVHAYLFIGPAHIGKFTLAKNFAKVLECEVQKDDFCGQCPSCKQIEAGNWPDVFILDGEELIKIEDIRRLQHNLNLSHFRSIYKIIIIANAERLTPEAANCLLKILEDPPPKTIFILTSSFPDDVLPTIVSRCQIIKMHPLLNQEIESGLIKEGFKKEDFKYGLVIGEGRIGIVKKLLSNKEFLEDQIHLLEKLLTIKEKDYLGKLELASKILELKTTEFLDFWVSFLRKAILLKFGYKETVLDPGFEERIVQFSQSHSLKELQVLVEKAQQAKKLLRNSSLNNKLIVENLLLGI